MISPELSRLIARAVYDTSPDLAVRRRIAEFARTSQARSWQDLPGWLRAFLEKAGASPRR